MKVTRLFLLSSLLLVGCVRSVHPFYTDAQLTFDPALIGTWVRVEDSEQKESLTVTGNADTKQYDVIYTDDEKKSGSFVVHLFKVQDRLIADVLPAELKTPDSGVYGVHFLPLHSFMVVNYNAGTIRFRQMEPDWLKKQLEAQPALLKHEKVDDQIILTAPTDQLQQFILKHIDTQGAFGEPAEFRWAPPTTMPVGF